MGGVLEVLGAVGLVLFVLWLAFSLWRAARKEPVVSRPSRVVEDVSVDLRLDAALEKSDEVKKKVEDVPSQTPRPSSETSVFPAVRVRPVVSETERDAVSDGPSDDLVSHIRDFSGS